MASKMKIPIKVKKVIFSNYYIWLITNIFVVMPLLILTVIMDFVVEIIVAIGEALRKVYSSYESEYDLSKSNYKNLKEKFNKNLK